MMFPSLFRPPRDSDTKGERTQTTRAKVLSEEETFTCDVFGRAERRRATWELGERECLVFPHYVQAVGAVFSTSGWRCQIKGLTLGKPEIVGSQMLSHVITLQNLTR
ncbi:hypothetical protein WMY93_006313 [Mugilogobius chulae]|uniref:Ig-like domain-containing protein n=1 Tax=Mugilogobius chulae TaxID=88201 RepID=A0AAW0PJC1_9GOBI